MRKTSIPELLRDGILVLDDQDEDYISYVVADGYAVERRLESDNWADTFFVRIIQYLITEEAIIFIGDDHENPDTILGAEPMAFEVRIFKEIS